MSRSPKSAEGAGDKTNPHSATYGRFAGYLQANKQQICAEWLEAVRDDRTIPSTGSLPEPLLIDHVPQLLEDIARILSGDLRVSLMSEASVMDAQEHGVHRFTQGYELGEMLRELAVFRSVIVQHSSAFAETDETFRGVVESDALSRIHRFIDESSRWSAIRFVFEQQRLLREANESRLNVLNGISHELGNALNGINLAARTLARANESQIAQVQRSIVRGVQFMMEMLDDLRELARLEAGDERLTVTRFAPLAIAQDIEMTYGAMAVEKGLEFSSWVDPNLVELISDQRRVKQVAVNLVSNAVKYTAAGQVCVEFQEIDAERWMLRVKDTGVGIPREFHDKIFQEFFRVTSATDAEGMGLGLAIATRQVQLLQGSITLDSEPGAGCSFEIIFPKVLQPR